MHYNPSVDLAFISSEHIIRDVFNGWLIRYTHANAVSMFFILVYIHIARRVYIMVLIEHHVVLYGIIGVVIYILYDGYQLIWLCLDLGTNEFLGCKP